MTTPYVSEAFIHQVLGKALGAGASDVHLRVGQPPGARVRGDLVYFRVEKIRPEDTEAAARILVGADRISRGEVSASYHAPGLGRFRVNAFVQQARVGMVFRTITTDALQGVAAGKYALDSGIKKLTVIHVNNDFGVNMVREFSKAYGALGGTLVSVTPYNPSQASYQPEVTKALQGTPDGFRDLQEADAPGSKGLHGDFVRGIQHGWQGPSFLTCLSREV